MVVPPEPAALAREYAASRRRIGELVRPLGDEAVATRIPSCPAWDVRALCSHVTGIAADLVARRNPDGDTQVWVDRQIAERADRPVTAIIDEWDEVGPAFEALIERKPAAFGGLLYDLVAHEHDLRHAIGRPGARDGDGVVLAMGIERDILHRDILAQGLPAVRLAAGGHEFLAGEGEIGLELDLGDRPDGVFELLRAFGSRRSRRQLGEYPWQGDLDRFLPALAHMPLPEHDLIE